MFSSHKCSKKVPKKDEKKRNTEVVIKIIYNAISLDSFFFNLGNIGKFF